MEREKERESLCFYEMKAINRDEGERRIDSNKQETGKNGGIEVHIRSL